jgi:hypothetical protein
LEKEAEEKTKKLKKWQGNERNSRESFQPALFFPIQ